ALGEKWLGLCKGIENFLCVTIGRGIGLGIIKNRNVYQIAVYLCREDVKHIAEDIRIPLSDKDISAILKNVLDKYHREDGITWDTILCEIEEIAGRSDDGVLDFHL
ncbi:unnamed protein product, partial [marine sediment metagenome]